MSRIVITVSEDAGPEELLGALGRAAACEADESRTRVTDVLLDMYLDVRETGTTPA